MICELAWWYRQPVEYFLGISIRRFFRLVSEMYHLQAKHEILNATSTAIGTYGRREDWESLEEQAYGTRARKQREEAQRETSKRKRTVERFHAALDFLLNRKS